MGRHSIAATGKRWIQFVGDGIQQSLAFRTAVAVCTRKLSSAIAKRLSWTR